MTNPTTTSPSAEAMDALIAQDADLIDVLKPCPFCGGDSELGISPDAGNTCHFVCCGDCGCEGPFEPTRHEAIAAWNKRADRIEALEAENARLRERLEVIPGLSDDTDGIACRDETIKLSDARIAALKAREVKP